MGPKATTPDRNRRFPNFLRLRRQPVDPPRHEAQQAHETNCSGETDDRPFMSLH